MLLLKPWLKELNEIQERLKMYTTVLPARGGRPGVWGVRSLSLSLSLFLSLSLSQIRETGGAPRNPAHRNHLLVWIVKPSGCHCTDGHLTSRVSLRIKNIVECRPPLGALPLSLTRRIQDEEAWATVIRLRRVQDTTDEPRSFRLGRVQDRKDEPLLLLQPGGVKNSSKESKIMLCSPGGVT